MPKDEGYVAKFQSAVNFIEDKITSGEWPPGHKLPSQAAWKDLYGYNYGTLRQAYLILKATGKITGRQGEGVYVVDPEEK